MSAGARFRVEPDGPRWHVVVQGADESTAVVVAGGSEGGMQRTRALEALEMFLADGQRALQALLDLQEYPPSAGDPS